MISSIITSMPICNWFHARRANIAKIFNFYRGTPLWRSRAQASLNLGGSGLGLFDAEKFHLQVVLVYLQPFRRNSLLKCALQPKMRKKIAKTPLLELKVVMSTCLHNVSPVYDIGTKEVICLFGSMHSPTRQMISFPMLRHNDAHLLHARRRNGLRENAHIRAAIYHFISTPWQQKMCRHISWYCWFK